MDRWEASRVVLQRLLALDSENAYDIVKTLLNQDNGEQELIRLAFGPDKLLHSIITRARAEITPNPLTQPLLLQSGHSWGMSSTGGEQMVCHGSEASYPSGFENHWLPTNGEIHRRPCIYYARGFCRNGSSCRFLHIAPEDDVMQRIRALVMRPPQLFESFTFSPSPRGLNFMFQQQQSEPQRVAATLPGGEGTNKFSARSPRVDRDYMNTPVARQIYLTFPADSSFTKDDVVNYFSTYGPVQDVRIPHQKNRMFGFVTFVYPETVKTILSKGNPHFVRDARVLVKPYKEKGMTPNRKLQHPHHRREFPGCATPTGLLHPRGPVDLQQPQIGTRMMLGFEEQQQVQQANELQNRRFMGLQLLDPVNRGRQLGSPVGLPMPKHEQQQKQDGDAIPKQAVDPGEEKGEPGAVAATTNAACGLVESGMDHNLPESLLASPTKAKASIDNTGDTAQNGNVSPYHMASSLFLPTSSSLKVSLYNSGFFQVPRFTSGHEEIGL